jgi:hypothetical protein
MVATLIIGVILVLFGIAVLAYPPLLAVLAGIALILGGAVMIYRALTARGRAV